MPSAQDGLRIELVDTVDTKELIRAAEKAACSIYVGFLSGRQHVPTLHKNADGEYKGYNGESIEQIQPVDTAELARQLHFGTATIPARPFLEEGVMCKEKEIYAAFEEEAKKAVDGGSANWDKVGTMAVGAVQEFVRGDHYKSTIPNSQKTIDYKGSDKPLIDGGDLINSLEFLVEDK